MGDKGSILFVVDSLGTGGAGRVVAILANQLKKSYRVSIADFTIDDGNYLHDSNLINIYHLRSKQHVRGRMGLFDKCRLIKSVAKRENADVVISFGADMNIYSSIAHIGSSWKLIVCIRNNPRTSPKEKKMRVIRKLLYPFANGFIFQTFDERAYFNSMIQTKGIIIENPVAADLPEPFHGEKSRKIVMVGRLNNQKNYPMAIKAFRIIHDSFKDYKLEIYGSGELKHELQELISKEQVSDCVELMGHRENVWDEIKDASLFLLTSNYEGMSNALIEAMALGIPSISTDHPVGGARQLIKNGKNGWLVQVNNIEDLCEKMSYVLSNFSIAKQVGINALEIRERLSISEISLKWEDYINYIIGGGE